MSISFSAFQTCVLAEPPDTAKTQSTEERLAAIEGKLQQLENRLDQALGISSLKPGATGVAAEAVSATPLSEQLAALDQKLRIVERNKELDAEATSAKLKETPVVSAGQGRILDQIRGQQFSIESGRVRSGG